MRVIMVVIMVVISACSPIEQTKRSYFLECSRNDVVTFTSDRYDDIDFREIYSGQAWYFRTNHILMGAYNSSPGEFCSVHVR